MSNHDAYLWLTRPEECLDRDLVAYYESLLNPAERNRMESYRLPHLRHEFLMTRALCRTMLASFTGAEPRALQFSSNAYGRPKISFPVSSRGLSFNLSNMPGLIACGVAEDADIGVDIASRSDCFDDLVDVTCYFASAERAALARLPADARSDYFQVLWALKESYIKACGMGLSIPLASFAMNTSGDRVGIDFAAARSDKDRWQFELVRPDPTHLVAIALRKPGARDLCVHTQTVVPGIDHATTAFAGRYRQT